MSKEISKLNENNGLKILKALKIEIDVYPPVLFLLRVILVPLLYQPSAFLVQLCPARFYFSRQEVCFWGHLRSN